ncbi:MAG: adenylate kinase [Thermoproteota archaeon]|nr:adenylate kinase [Thermoproteota archaeon]
MVLARFLSFKVLDNYKNKPFFLLPYMEEMSASRILKESKTKVIVITGSPGVGKSTVSKALADKLEALYVSLTDVVKNEKLTLRFDEQRDTFIADLNRLSKRVEEIIGDAPGDVIIEGHYAPDVVPASLASHVFVLRFDPDSLRTRLEKRGYSEKKILENIESEALDICLVNAIERYGEDKVDEIDATQRTVEEVVEEITQVLGGRRPMKVGKVDWLGKMELEGRLEEFLSKLNWV